MAVSQTVCLSVCVCVCTEVRVKISFTVCDVRVMLADLREASRRVRKLSMVWKTVALPTDLRK